MKICEMVYALEKIRDFGGDLEVYFDDGHDYYETNIIAKDTFVNNEPIVMIRVMED